MGKDKQYWSVSETIALLKLWSSLRQQLDRATRTKDSYEEIQRALAAQGHERELEQIVNKIKKLKMEFKEMSRSTVDRDYCLKRNMYLNFLEQAFGRREEAQAMESDEDGIWERACVDDMDKLRKSMQESSCLLRACSAAEVYQRPCRPTEDIQSHDQASNKEHGDHGADQNTPGRLRSTMADGLGKIEDSVPLHTTVTIKTEFTEDMSLISPPTSSGPLCSKSDWVKDTVTPEKSSMSQSNHEPAACSSDFKIEYVVTEDDFISFSVPSPRPVLKPSSEKWLDAEVQALLSLYATKKMERDFSGQKHNMRIFEKISNDLANIGIFHSTKQCREKVKKLKQDYKKIKDINESGAELKKSKWFNILDSILGRQLESESAAATSENSPTEPLESIFSEHNAEARGGTEESVPESENNSVQLSIDPVLSSSGLKIACVVSEAADGGSFSSFLPHIPGPKVSSDKWFDAEVKALLSLYATKEMERDSEGQTNTRIFEKISNDLANIGIHHSSKHCREKIKKLKQDYRKIKEYNNQNGAEIKTSKWYDILDSILGHLPAYSGSGGIRTDNTSAETPESLWTENSTDTTDSLDRLSKPSLMQPCLDRLRGSAHVAFTSGDIPNLDSPALRGPTGPLFLDSICASPDGFKTNNDKWHDAEVQAFLSIYATKKMQQEAEGQTQTKIFPGISKDLAKIGIHRTARNCREKIKKLKQDYRRIKSHNESGAQFKKSKWYNILDSILGHDPVYSASAAAASDNSSMEPLEESYGAPTESMACAAKLFQDQPGSHLPLGSAPETLVTGSPPKPSSPSPLYPSGNTALETTHTENNVETKEEIISEPEASVSQVPHPLQRPDIGSVPCPSALRSTAFRFRPVKRKRRESSELVECLERIHEQHLQHSRDMHEALLTRMDSHMNRVIRLMERMAAAMEAQAAKTPQPH